MSRLYINTPDTAQIVVEGVYKDLERRIIASPPGICPVEVSLAFLKLCHAQTCGKCVPCRVGLGKLQELIENVLDGTATMDTIKQIEDTTNVIIESADCAIGFEAAEMVAKGLKGFREDFVSHIKTCKCSMDKKISVPCVALCPAGVDVPGYIALVGEGRYADAVRLIRKDNPFPVACALVCEHPCEARCRRTMIDAPLNIRGMKKYAVENAGIVPPPPCEESTGKSVAIIGGGPSGLSAAYYLALMGHHVDVYEKREQLGGMLRYGIPKYRLPRERLQEDIDAILDTGVNVYLNVEIGKDMEIGEIAKGHDATYIAIGAHEDKKLGIDGEDAKGVVSAVSMLKTIGDENYPDLTGKKVVVIGGGNVAMDTARTAMRCNAETVSIVYRRRKEDMTCLPEEIEEALIEGCDLYSLMAPMKIEKDSEGNVDAIWIQPQIVGELDSKQRPRPRQAIEEPIRLECNHIIVAIGQNIESKAFREFGMPVKRGIIEALNSSEIENIPGIFAGGDCVTGPATVIKAIGAGKVAAANIDEYLGFNHLISVDIEVPEIKWDDRNPCARANMSVTKREDRHNFNEIECALTPDEAKQEASRCLRCDHFGWGQFRGGRQARW